MNHHHHHPLQFSVKASLEFNRQLYQHIDSGVTLPQPILLFMMIMPVNMMMMMRRMRMVQETMVMLAGRKTICSIDQLLYKAGGQLTNLPALSTHR